MAKVTPGFKLYLYQLLSRELGTGRQTLLPQVEQVLLADDILPEDLECESVQELIEACPDFLKLTVFKKGRAYATVLANKEWDEMLAAPPEKKPEKAAQGGHKAWKKKKGGKKVLKAVKPGKKRRDREAAEAERLAAEALASAALKAEGAAEALAIAVREAQNVTGDAVDTPSEPVPVMAREQADETEQPTPNVDETSGQPIALTLAEVLEAARAAEAESAGGTETAAPPEPEPEAEVRANPEPAPELEYTPEPALAAAVEAVSPTPEPDPEPVAAEPNPEPEPAPLAPEPSPISLTITYDPYEDMERELARQAAEAAAQRESTPEPEPAPQRIAPVPAPAAASPSVPLADLPQSMHTEVSCKDALLRALYQLLPYDVEPMAILDEDWRVARSTGDLSGTRNRISFPLRYRHEDGTPITVTLRKTIRNASGRKWSLALVDGDDGSGISHEAIGFEGLPAVDDGAWSDLCSTTPVGFVSPTRELAQEVVIGTWDSLLGSLATMAAPERWNYPGEGVGRASRYGILREYLANTYHRARRQDRFATSADGSFAAFNTGLVTAFGEDIYACLTARGGDIPWQFVGFATAGSGELGSRLAGTIAPLPSQPTYLSSIDSVVADQNRMVILDLEAIIGAQLGRLPRAFLTEQLDGNAAVHETLAGHETLTDEDLTRLARAIKADGGSWRRMRRALDDAVEQTMRSLKTSYRLAVPVYDPTENRTKLLVPLCLVEEGHADCGLVLDLQPSGAYRAAAIVPLARAYACARVISREQPAWLAADRVL